MSKPILYLAGAIKGLSYESSTNWREYVKEKLYPEIIAISPMRCKEYLAKET